MIMPQQSVGRLDLLRLNVPVDDLHRMQVLHTRGDLQNRLLVVEGDGELRVVRVARGLDQVGQRGLAQVQSDEEEVVSSFLAVVWS